jgi:hypothetical protein
MTTKKELQLAYRLAGILIVVGIFSYVAASFAEPPLPPLRVMYRSVTGNVLFEHKAHFSPGNYSVSCQDCHHDTRTLEDYIQVDGKNRIASEAGMNLADAGKIEDIEVYTNKEEAHELCIGCHEEFEAGPVDCKGCHVM